jgi:hypothetical protein
MWGDSKFLSLSSIPACGQGLWLYLLSNTNTNAIPGLYKAGRMAMAEDLGWELEAFDKAFDEVSKQGMAEADFKARVVWIPNAVKHNKPESPNVVLAWAKEINTIPECDLKNKAIHALYEAVQDIDNQSDNPEKQSYTKAFIKGFGEALCKASLKTSPNQEQEQEQDKNTCPPSGEPEPAKNQNQNFKNEIQEIFEFWKSTFGKSNQTVLDNKRKTKIQARLKEGYTVDQIKQGILGCSKSTYHIEHKHIDIELICREAAKLDRFIEMMNPVDQQNTPPSQPIDISKYKDIEGAW